MALPEVARRTSLLVAGAVFVAGCCSIFSPCKTKPDQADYLPRTSPENVITNLKTLYTFRDARQYDSTLSESYVFRFLPTDILGGAPDSLQRYEEMEFAEHLFQTGVPGAAELPPASSISMDVSHSLPEADPRLGHAGWVKYRVTTSVRVNFATSNNDLEIVSPAIWYFRMEPEGSGLWRLAEWQDQTPSSAAPRGGTATLRRLYPGDSSMGPEALFCKPMRPSQKAA